jgi:hypothetical protein
VIATIGVRLKVKMLSNDGGNNRGFHVVAEIVRNDKRRAGDVEEERVDAAGV